jgi:hypothetical protein
MNAIPFIRKIMCGIGLTAMAVQAAIGPSGEVFILGGELFGHQRNPHLHFDANGGFVVWEHVSNTSNGARILVQPMNALMGHKGSPVRVSEFTERNDERKPQVSVLPNGGAVVVWEAGPRKARDIYARFLDVSGRPLGGAQIVNSFDRGNQDSPSVAVNQKGDVWVTWESQYQDGAGNGIYARRFNAQGIKVGSEIQVSQTIKWNQFSPDITVLKNGNFVITWVSEVEHGKQLAMAGTGTYGQAGAGESMKQVSVPFMRSRVMGRILKGIGEYLGNEFRIDGGQAICSNPDIAGITGGGFAIVWEELNESGLGLGQDIYSRQFSQNGQPTSDRQQHNKISGGNQVNPALAVTEKGVLIVWDCGSDVYRGEEIHGRLLSGGAEMRMNTQVLNRQYMAAAAGNGKGKLMVVWADVVSPVNIILKARYFTTANPLINLAAGPDVTGGGQGPKKIILVAQKEKVSPGRVSMRAKNEQAVSNMIVKHESEIAEAMRTTQASAKAAAGAVQNAAAQNSRSQQSRNIARVNAPQSVNAVARPVNAQVVQPAGNHGVTSQQSMGGVKASFGMHSSGAGALGTSYGDARVSMKRRPISIRGSSKGSSGSQLEAAPSSLQPTTGTQRGGIQGISGGRAPVSLASNQAARNTLMSTARNYTSPRRLGMMRSAPNIRSGSLYSPAANRASFNVQNRFAAGNSNRGVLAPPSGRRPVTIAQSSGLSGQIRSRNIAERSLGGAFSGGTSVAQGRLQGIRAKANEGTVRAQLNRNIAIPSTVILQNGRMNLRFNSRPGSRYMVEMSNDRNNWSPVGRSQAGTGRTMSIPIQSNGQRFIRVVPRD